MPVASTGLAPERQPRPSQAQPPAARPHALREPARARRDCSAAAAPHAEVHEPGDDQHADHYQTDEGRGRLLVAVVLLFFLLLFGECVAGRRRRFRKLLEELLDRPIGIEADLERVGTDEGAAVNSAREP